MGRGVSSAWPTNHSLTSCTCDIPETRTPGLEAAWCPRQQPLTLLVCGSSSGPEKHICRWVPESQAGTGPEQV